MVWGKEGALLWGVLIRKDSMDEVRLENQLYYCRWSWGEGISRRGNGMSQRQSDVTQ